MFNGASVGRYIDSSMSTYALSSSDANAETGGVASFMETCRHEKINNKRDNKIIIV